MILPLLLAATPAAATPPAPPAPILRRQSVAPLPGKLDGVLEETSTPPNGDDWLDLQVAEVKLNIGSPDAVQTLIDRRAKKRPDAAKGANEP